MLCRYKNPVVLLNISGINSKTNVAGSDWFTLWENMDIPALWKTSDDVPLTHLKLSVAVNQDNRLKYTSILSQICPAFRDQRPDFRRFHAWFSHNPSLI